jgi:peptide/nickel transport system permease protein
VTAMARRRAAAIPQALSGLILLVMLALCAFPDAFSPDDPLKTQPGRRLQPPSASHILGTDYLGRDILSRVIHGARVSLIPALAVVAVAGAVGSLVGLVGGYVGGWLDEGLMRLTDVFLAVPAFVLAMAIATALGPSARNAAIAVIVVWWPSYARLARSEAQVLAAVEFVQAASASGASHIRILLRHMLPNQTSSLIVKASLDAGTVLLLLSGLSFLGIGAQSPTPEWGLEVATSRQYMFERPWYTIGASAAIFLAVYSMNLAGDAVRERLDPRLRNL